MYLHSPRSWRSCDVEQQSLILKDHGGWVRKEKTEETRKMRHSYVIQFHWTVFGEYLAVFLGTSLVYKQWNYFCRRQELEIQMLSVLGIFLLEETSKIRTPRRESLEKMVRSPPPELYFSRWLFFCRHKTFSYVSCNNQSLTRLIVTQTCHWWTFVFLAAIVTRRKTGFVERAVVIPTY